MANTTHPKSSGFDDEIEAKLDNINTREELLEDTGKLNQYLEHVHGAAFRAEKVMKEADGQIERLESVTKSVEKSAKLIEPALNSMADNISKDKHFHFTARLEDAALDSIKDMHREFIEGEKEFLNKHLISEANMITSFAQKQAKVHAQFMTALNQSFDYHKSEMERIQRYGEGVWLNKRTWQWVIGLIIVWGVWFVASITFLIIKATQ
jgi:hypothetical protein